MSRCPTSITRIGLVALITAMVLTLAPVSPASAAARNPATDWFMQGKFGLFAQWLYGGGDITGDWDTLVDDFDVDYFAKQASETGAKYVIFTLGQNSGYFASPNATYDGLVGRTASTSRMSTRDLPEDLYDALHPYGIELMLYLPARSPSDDPAVGAAMDDAFPIYDNYAPQAFQANWEDVIQEWSDRYGSKIAGWWFDGTYNTGPTYGKPDISQAYTDYGAAHNFQTFDAAAKSGNPDAIVTFDPGLVVEGPMTPYQDFITGEQNVLQYVPSQYTAAPYSRWIGGAQWSETAYQGYDWARNGLKYTTLDFTNYFSTVTNQSGVISIGPNISKDGHINSAQYAQLVTMNNAIRGVGPGVTVVEDNAAAITYSGTWSTSVPSGTGYSANNGHFTTTAGSYAEYTFNGTNVVWSGAKGPDHGTADVYIDGVLDNSVDLYAAHRFVNTEIYSKVGLSNGPHTIRIVARSDNNTDSVGHYVEVDRFNVTTGTATVIDDAAPGFSYSGTWGTSVPSGTGYSNDTGHFSTTSGSYAQYAFTGSSIEWYGVVGPDHGKADVYIDGVLDQTVDLYSPSRHVDNQVYVKRGLSNASHTIKIVARSDKNAASSGYYVEVDRLDSSRGTPIVTWDDASSQLAYTGTWNTAISTGTGYYKDTGHHSTTTGAFMQATFTGTSVEWRGKTDADHGKADVYIDGVWDQTVDLYSEEVYNDIAVYRKQGLSSGSHTIKVVVRSDRNVRSTNNYVEVDALTFQ